MKTLPMIAMALMAVLSAGSIAGDIDEDYQTLSNQLDENLWAAEAQAEIAEDTKAVIQDISDLITAKGLPSSVWISPLWASDYFNRSCRLHVLNLGSEPVEVEASFFSFQGVPEGIKNLGLVQPGSTASFYCSSASNISSPGESLEGVGWLQVVASGDVLVDGRLAELHWGEPALVDYLQWRTMSWYPLAKALEY